MGRPNEMNSMKERIFLRILKEEKEKWKEVADQIGKDLSVLIRDAVRKSLDIKDQASNTRGWIRRMPYGIIVLSTNLGNKTKNADPIFKVIAKENMYEDIDTEKVLDHEERTRVYYNHKIKLNSRRLINDYENLEKIIQIDSNFSVYKDHSPGYYFGNICNNRFSIISYYSGSDKKSEYPEYLICTLIDPIDSYERFKEITKYTYKEIMILLKKYGRTEKESNMMKDISEKIEIQLLNFLYRWSRWVKLNDEQKIAQIFYNPERVSILKKLEEGEIKTEDFYEFLKEKGLLSKVDFLLKPFDENNIISRRWSRGIKDPKTGRIKDRGEYISLNKQIKLIRVRPELMLAKMEDKNERMMIIDENTSWKIKVHPFDDEIFVDGYLKAVNDFFNSYNPNYDIEYKDASNLALALLDPDMYDYIVLLRYRAYPKERIPNIGKGDTQSILESLKDMQIIKFIEDKHGKEWAIQLSDPTISINDVND